MITAASVTATAGDAISAASGGGDISISGAHTVLGTGGRGIFVDSDGGAITIQGVGVPISGDDTSGAVRGTMGHGIHADARGATEGTGGSITIGGSGDDAIGAVSGSLRGIHAPTDGEGSAITIDSSQAAVVGGAGWYLG